jgi:enamine deaminase RidA (YjgF/YER057c/UK114 family)
VPEICHRVGIAAPRHRVYEEFATKGGVVEFRTPVEGDPELGGKLNFFFGGGIAEQTEQTMRNIEVLLRAAGASLNDVVSCLVHLADLAGFTKFNVVYAGQFPSETKPVRTTGRADLVADMRVEVTAVAYRAR